MTDATLFTLPAPAPTGPKKPGRKVFIGPKPPCSVDGCDAEVTKGGKCEPHYQAARRANSGPCAADGCDTPAQVTGLCLRHYHRKRRWGTTDEPEPTPALGACSVDGCDDTVKSRGMCGKHYARDQRSKYGQCTIDGCDSGATNRKGHCAKHYARLLAHGTTEDRPRRRKGAIVCVVEGCGAEVRAKNLCVMHYARFMKYGTTDDLKPDQERFYCKGCRQWVTPGAYSPHNARCLSCVSREKRETNLFRAYRIFAEDYDAQLERQAGLCAICGKPQADNPTRFHVDHNHETGAMRGLLCGECNLGLGKFLDDPRLLEIAAIYLRTH